MPLPDTIQDAEERSLSQKSSKSLKKGGYCTEGS
uniref:Uncharacterized protein n=1 Tax=Anguilla anguilla TaxID=7936 RepID=A0A0E9W5D1_ANGAN